MTCRLRRYPDLADVLRGATRSDDFALAFHVVGKGARGERHREGGRLREPVLSTHLQGTSLPWRSMRSAELRYPAGLGSTALSAPPSSVTARSIRSA